MALRSYSVLDILLPSIIIIIMFDTMSIDLRNLTAMTMNIFTNYVLLYLILEKGLHRILSSLMSTSIVFVINTVLLEIC